ncbi:endonuclease MutS2 [uncultured Selenomonas sp.]|uniref:endonuclease MutS2 n=1 Tax=uncultured Selenomonas sp. TaxID=159275 RepID=UPI0028DB3745|nr:endonuclease MutS2 [uncultured Selenomonas sp.]
MEKETLDTLEYDKIRAMLEARAGSILGKEKARAILPSSDFDEVAELLHETEEAVRLSAFSSPPLGGIFDIRESLAKAGRGAVLDLGDFTDLLSTMHAMRAVKHFFKEMELDVPIVKEQARGIEILGQLERRLENSIDMHGNMLDDASVELSRIRRELRSGNRRAKEQMEAILHRTEYQKFFQDAIITQRGERNVIPIKQEYRQSFPGIVHDQSASGATLFIEPLALVDLNNDLKQLALAEKNEMQRILRLLSQAVGENSSILKEKCTILAHLDFIFARAKLAAAMQATKPALNREGRTKLVAARHPLIEASKVVPIDLALGKSYHMLLVTGPNTGGKTVSLKTLGLFALMVQSGCYIPAAAGSEISVYPSIYTVIGDEQSIEQSLSTFSAHMSHMVKLLERAERADLLLIDEIGAGTDPEEGAALAMAILEQFLARGTSTIVTTHYSELKTFAFTREGIENACVEFDVETLRPTYRLLTGMPGASNAFAISRRLGLSEAAILRAQQFIKADHAQFEKVVNQLESEKLMYEQRNADILERQQRVTKLEEKTLALKAEIQEKKEQMLKKARQESAALVRRTRQEAEEIIKSLKAQFDDLGIESRRRAMQEAREKLQEAAERSRTGLIPGKAYKEKIDMKKLAVGDIVYVRKLDQKATVLKIQGANIEVQLGSLKTYVKAGDCRFVERAGKEPLATGGKKRGRGAGTLLQKTANLHREIDVRGLMVDEAEQVIGKFLDDAVIGGLGQVLIIHGKGTGALRKGVHDYLKHHKSVARYNFADMSEGGTGATLVDLQ